MIKFLILTSVSFFSPEIKKDSIGIETINGKIFVIHKIEAGETLYGISKRYAVTVEQILEFNPTADAGLEVGQILKVPYVPRTVRKKSLNGDTHIVGDKETLFSISRQYGVTVDELKQWNSLSENGIALGQELIVKGKRQAVQPTNPPIAPKSDGVTHTVASKETMFSITRQYGITRDQLKEWNNLQTDELKIGQILFVTQQGYAKKQSDTPVPPIIKVDSSKSVPVQIKNTDPADKPVDNVPTIKISENVRGSDEIVETGIAELIDGTEGNRKYLALHRTAPIGTILKIRNEMNSREVFVRVMGKLPDTGLNDKLVIKISKSAYDRLGAIDSRFRVEVTYYK
jgi:LysM repeat protein